MVYLKALRNAMKNRLIALALLTKWESGAAAALGGTAAGLAASTQGADPWTWILSGLGAAVVYVKKPATSRLDAIVNSGISVALGGVVAPAIALVIAERVDTHLGNPRAIALLLAACWPWLIALAHDKLKDFSFNKKGDMP